MISVSLWYSGQTSRRKRKLDVNLKRKSQIETCTYLDKECNLEFVDCLELHLTSTAAATIQTHPTVLPNVDGINLAHLLSTMPTTRKRVLETTVTGL